MAAKAVLLIGLMMLQVQYYQSQKTLNVYRELLKNDVYISLSRGEGCSHTMVQALACSKPIVASNVPGNRDCIINGLNGYIVDSNIISCINDSLSFLKSSKVREKFSVASLDIYNERFSRLKVCPNYLSLFT